MRLLPSDPDIATIVRRIEEKIIDLQPEFQRGEVWSTIKKQRLIDTILRDWHIPPVHVIENSETAKQEVLDGQQRLAAIRDFVRDVFTVDGDLEPSEDAIQSLDGKRYSELPAEWKRRFDQFTIRVFRITDYTPEEPGELFFRLNQPSSLTSAEQRNAFFGPARAQVKRLVQAMETSGLDKTNLGFSNSRMAYDDVIARMCASLEMGSIAIKVTSSTLTQKYRSREDYPETVIDDLLWAISKLGSCREQLQGRVKLNKATLFSWLWFSIDARVLLDGPTPTLDLGEVIVRFDEACSARDGAQAGTLISEIGRIYIDRATSRVADVSSVLSRDAAIWVGVQIFFETLLHSATHSKLKRVRDMPVLPAQDLIEYLIALPEWTSA